MKKIKKILLVFSLLVLFTASTVNASACTKEAAMQLGKIVYRESGADTLSVKEDNFFRRLNVASVALNNASRKKGSNWYQKIYNLDNNAYGSYSSYKDTSYTSLVDTSKQGEILYISELVLSGKYNLPSNMYLQAEPEIVNRYGKVWTNIGSIYIGYEGDTLSSKDVFGNKLPSNTVSYYKDKAKSLMLSDYSAYTTTSVCTGKSDITNPEDNNNNNNNNNFMGGYNSVVSPKSWLVTLLLCLFVGVFGIHRFYAGKIGTGIIMILLCWTGISAIWALVDLIMIILSKFKDGQGLLIQR